MSTARRIAKLEAVRERLRVVRWHSYVVFENVEATPAEGRQICGRRRATRRRARAAYPGRRFVDASEYGRGLCLR